LNSRRMTNHRGLVALVGLDDEALADHASRIISLLGEFIESPSGLYMYQPSYSDAQRRMQKFKERVNMNVEYRSYKDSEELLGITVDFAVLDFMNDLRPNDVGRLGGIVRGGGLYVIMIPPIEEWLRRLTRFQETLVTPQYKPSQVRHNFKLRFWRKLLDNEDALIIDVSRGEVVREPRIVENPPSSNRTVVIPEKTRFPRRIYELAKTQDQVEALRIMEELLDKPPRGSRVNVVLVADRGRGKSAVVGLALAALAHRIRKAKGRVKFAVSAMSPRNVSTLMRFLIMGLGVLGYDPSIVSREDQVVTVKVGGSIFVDYVAPYELLREGDRDIVVIDEAAMVPLPVLYGIHARFSRVIYASTIHGYEGAGRGFSIRFLKYLRSRDDTRVLEYELSEPIRYAPDDPVERWLFDTLLLDAEPAKIDASNIDLGSVEYLVLNDDFFFNDEALRNFFGIYVQAHYRNEPDDLGMMMDAPHHFIRALSLSGGKIVVSVELAEEGGIDEGLIELVVKGLKLPGNIIPDRLIKYWGLVDFAKLKGWRIVRIATHPDLQGRGLGSEALRRIEEEAVSKGIAWLGVGFGVSAELLRFWLRNGYVPVHISPERNPISGEYSVLLVKPLSREAKNAVEYANREFKIRLLESLHSAFRDLEPDVVSLLARGSSINAEPGITEAQLRRLIAYAWGPMTFENTVDAVEKLARAYLLSSDTALPELHRELLIAKALQSRGWDEVSRMLNLRRTTCILMMREVVRLLIAYFYGSVDVPLFMIGALRSARGDQQ